MASVMMSSSVAECRETVATYNSDKIGAKLHASAAEVWFLDALAQWFCRGAREDGSGAHLHR